LGTDCGGNDGAGVGSIGLLTVDGAEFRGAAGVAGAVIVGWLAGGCGAIIGGDGCPELPPWITWPSPHEAHPPESHEAQPDEPQLAHEEDSQPLHEDSQPLQPWQPLHESLITTSL
jgi:hypothetical protein